MSDDIETIRKGLTLYPRVNKDSAHDALDRIEAELDAWKHRLDRLEAELAEAKQETVRVIFKKKDLRVAKDARVIALVAEVERLRAECEIGARRNRTMEETIERLRDEIADLRGDGFPALAEDKPNNHVHGFSNDPPCCRNALAEEEDEASHR